MDENTAQHALLSVILYFDIFEHPLTLLEIDRFSTPARPHARTRSLDALRSSLESLVASGRIEQSDGYYFLKGRRALIATRKERYRIAAHKYRLAGAVARLLSRAPFVRMIAVCNSLSYANAREASDIDLFVVAKTGGVWWARFFSLALLTLLRLRPRARSMKDTLCLSFFVDEAHLDLQPLSLGAHDIYLRYWIATLYPLYDAGGFYERFWNENALAAGQNGRPVITHDARRIAHGMLIRRVCEILLRPWTPLARAIQYALFPDAIRSRINRDTNVCIGEGVLKFHTNDRRARYADQFRSRLAAFMP